MKIIGNSQDILGSVKKAINNSTINGKIVRLIMGTIELLVYPNDSFERVVATVKRAILLNELEELKATLAQ